MVPDIRPPDAAMAVVGIAGVAVVEVVGSFVVVVSVAKDIATVKAKDTPTALPLIRCAPGAEAIVRSVRRPCTATVPEKSGGQNRPHRYCVPRDDPRRERFFHARGRGSLL